MCVGGGRNKEREKERERERKKKLLLIQNISRDSIYYLHCSKSNFYNCALLPEFRIISRQ